MSPLPLLRSRLLAAALVVAPGCYVNETESVSCYAPKAGEACASDKDAPALLPEAGVGCERRRVHVEDGPSEDVTPAGRQCCYLVVDRRTLDDISFGCGRPMEVGDRVRVASLARRGSWG